MRHQHTDHKCELISDCSYSGKTLVEKRLFPEVMEIDKDFDPFHITFKVTYEQKKKYDDEFNSFAPRAGLLPEETVRDYVEDYLPVSSVDKISSLSDQDGDGCLDRYEWTVFNHLTLRVGDYADPIPYQVVTSQVILLCNNTELFTASP